LAGADLPDTSTEEQELTAPEAIIAMADEFPGELTFVSVGPATNLAMALALRPRIVDQIARVVIMGGAYFVAGNRTPHAEFNAFIDPDALDQVVNAAWKQIIAIGLDVTQTVLITPEVWSSIPADGDEAQSLVRGVSQAGVEGRAKDPFYLHDPLAVAVALDPSLVSTTKHAVGIETTGERRGHAMVTNGGNVEIATVVDFERFMSRFREAFNLG
jgi:inosine-uridine nucleoside N-ribohydrolase